MSPTSYQTAPPRTSMITDRSCTLLAARIQSAFLPQLFTAWRNPPQPTLPISYPDGPNGFFRSLLFPLKRLPQIFHYAIEGVDSPGETDRQQGGTMVGEIIVKPGDTLAQIAKNAYGDATLANTLATFNGIQDANRIFVGQHIEVPLLQDLVGAAPASAPAPQSQGPAAPAP